MFRKHTYSGIDFRDKSLSFATIKLERGIPVIQNVGITNMKEEMIKSGRVSQSSRLATELKNTFIHGQLAKNVHLAIPTQNILVRKITSLPDLGESELAKILQFQIGESIHLPFEDPIYDFVKIGAIIPNHLIKGNNDTEEEELSLDDLAKGIEENLEGPKSEILLFATSKLLSQDLVDVCSNAGLKPVTAEIRALALQRLLLYTHPKWLKKTEMIIDASENGMDIHIFKEDQIVFSRMMTINRMDYFFEANRKENDELVMELESFQMEESKREIAAASTAEMIQSEDTYFDEIVLEIEKAQNFYRYSMNDRDSEFHRIIVTGEKTDQIFEPLKNRIHSQRVERIDYRSISSHNVKDLSLLDTCSVAIGLAIRGNEK
ncbi:hypothetical protein G4Z05_05545 [Bacillus thermocopriae]|uniref:Pilus assembly protein PilM n=1 Tax=Neobacillus thermocopriae TaxID=1215031 RepID=A0A6B3TP01_9BACI|nr:hypothetical protein [Neobacillus thermocopriae]NEX78358.1 hypothetical protein [Neobacillus thermocopriae]